MHGLNFKDLIKKNGLTWDDLAERIGVTRRSISAYVYGERRPPPRIAERIGRELGLTKEEIWDMFYTDKTDRGA